MSKINIKYPGIAKMALNAQSYDTEEEALKYITSMITATRFMSGSGLQVSKKFKNNIHKRVELELKNPLEIREVTKKGTDIYVRILCEEQ